jgi:two-component system OmpR family response regulator
MAAISSCKIDLAAGFARSSLYPAARTPEREDVTAEPHILIVDDDAEICALVRQFLEPHSFRVTAAFDGPSMHAVLAKEPADLVILDLMLPGDDGLTLCRELRANSPIPIIFLTAVNSEADRVAGLELGADDYLSKPFSTRELLARVRAVLRRASPAPNELSQQMRITAQARRLRFSGWTLDTGRRQLTDPDGVLVDLSGGEYELLVAFLERPNIVLNRDQLLDITRGRYAGPFDRAIDMQVGRLRRKIEADPKNPVLIKTVRSGGYVLASPVEQR